MTRWTLGALALGGVMLMALAGCDRMAAGVADPDAAVAVNRVKEGFGSQQAAVRGFEAQAAAAATMQAGGGAALDQAVRTEGARALGVPPEQVTLDSVEAVQWADSSLGCAEAGKAYAPTLTPGFRAVVSAAAQHRQLHADTTGRVVVCASPTQ